MQNKSDILIIDDNKELALNLNDILSENGYSTSIVYDGKSAVECYRDKEFNLALVDMKLPDTEGLKLIDELSVLKPSLEFIIITGYGTMESAVHAVETEKIIAYITKPIDIRHLLVLINQLTKRKQAENERKQAEMELQKSREQLRVLSQHLQSTSEDERFKMTTGIFEDMSQTFSALKMDLSWLLKKISNLREIEIQKFQSMFELIDVSQKELRYISHEIRPSHLDTLGLLPTLNWYVSEFQKQTGIMCKTNFIPSDFEIPVDLTVNLYRIIKDLLNNVEKHSKANEVRIDIHLNNNKLDMKIIDDGIGIAEDKINNIKSLGILSIKERVLQLYGTFHISGEKGKETSVEINIPISENSEIKNI